MIIDNRLYRFKSIFGYRLRALLFKALLKIFFFIWWSGFISGWYSVSALWYTGIHSDTLGGLHDVAVQQVKKVGASLAQHQGQEEHEVVRVVDQWIFVCDYFHTKKFWKTWKGPQMVLRDFVFCWTLKSESYIPRPGGWDSAKLEIAWMGVQVLKRKTTYVQ